LVLPYIIPLLLEAIMVRFSPDGQGLVEYALVIMLIGIVVVVVLATYGTGVGNMFSNIVANI
jgi:pilus assembly protein Flp/PilA